MMEGHDIGTGEMGDDAQDPELAALEAMYKKCKGWRFNLIRKYGVGRRNGR